MAQSISKIETIKELIKQNFEKEYKSLLNQWSQIIQESNALLEKGKDSRISKTESYYNEIFVMIEKLNTTIDNYTQINADQETVKKIIGSYDKILEIGRHLEGNYRKLSLIYYNHNFSENAKKTEQLQAELQRISDEHETIRRETEKLNEEKQKFNEIVEQTNAKLESLGATFLNIVLTISITTTMVTVLLNASPKYALFIVLMCAWLLLSSIIFISAYFKCNTSIKENNKLATTVYIILTILTFGALLYGIFTNGDSEKSTSEQENIKQDTSIVINQ